MCSVVIARSSCAEQSSLLVAIIIASLRAKSARPQFYRELVITDELGSKVFL
jgi:hypothetical protein